MDLLGDLDFSQDRILVTGANGMVGSAVREYLGKLGLYPSYDLRDENAVAYMFNQYRPTHVIHLAAKVGGVKANSENLANFFTDNIRINTNVLDAAKLFNVKKVVSMLSTCIYPDMCSYPLTEEQIHDGPPHPSNYAYAYAKRMLDIQSKAYRDQFGCNFVTVVPNNLYGKNDSFNLENSHVIPAMIRKIYEAGKGGEDVCLWGDGSPLREFTYSRDIAQILLFLLKTYNDREPINVGGTIEYSIKYVAELIAEILGFQGQIIWDVSKPSGQLKKPSNNEKFLSLLGSCGKKIEYTNLYEGLIQMCNWFKTSYPNVRGY